MIIKIRVFLMSVKPECFLRVILSSVFHHLNFLSLNLNFHL